MKILLYMGGGFDTYGPSRHLYHALIEDLLAKGHTIHLIESHSTGKDPDAPAEFIANSRFSYQVVNSTPVEKRRLQNGI